MSKDLDVVLWAKEALKILKEQGHMIWTALLETTYPNNSSYNLKDGLEGNNKNRENSIVIAQVRNDEALARRSGVRKE